MPRELSREKPKIDETDDSVPFTAEDAPRSERVTKEVNSPLKRGWSADNRPRSSSKFVQAPRFTVSDDGEETLIKFMEDEPFAPLWQHWLMTEQGRRAYTCLGFNDCPLCAKGDKAKPSDWINVVVLGDTPELKVWYMSSDPASAVKERAQGKRTSPIDRMGLYFAVSKKKGSNGFFSYSVDPVKEEELKDDWGVEPLTIAQLEGFAEKMYDSSIVRFHTISELQEAGRKFLPDE